MLHAILRSNILRLFRFFLAIYKDFIGVAFNGQAIGVGAHTTEDNNGVFAYFTLDIIRVRW